MVEVVTALIWEGDRFMICQRPAHKTRGLLWEFVGGKVEEGETPAFGAGSEAAFWFRIDISAEIFCGIFQKSIDKMKKM